MGKFERHLAELGEMTSGGSHDAVTFSGKGLDFLRGLFKSASKKARKAEEEEPVFKDEFVDPDDMELDELEDFVEEHGLKGAPKQRRRESDEEYEERLRDFIRDWMEEQTEAKKNANGGDLEEEEEPEDPADDEEDIITNHGKRIPKKSLRRAVKKHNADDVSRFEKSMDDFEYEYGDVLDASPALEELARHVRSMVKSTSASMAEIKDTMMVLAKGLEQSLKAQAALAADLELIKKQPATSPATGFVVLNKGERGGYRRLSKSEIEDTLTELMNKGEVDPATVARLGSIRSDLELRDFVDNLPASVREKL